jgi:hypothetical protein
MLILSFPRFRDNCVNQFGLPFVAWLGLFDEVFAEVLNFGLIPSSGDLVNVVAKKDLL